MENAPALTRIAQVAGTAAALYLSEGYHYASDRLALPGVLLTADPATQAKQWFLGWDVGRKIGPLLVNVAFGSFTYLAWKDWTSTAPNFSLHAAAAVASGLVAPYTLALVFPINDVLLAEHEKVKKSAGKEVDGEVVRGNVQAWRSGDRRRAVMMHIAALAGIVGLMKP